MLVDSNIIIYAINTLSPKHKQAQIFLQNQAGSFQLAHQNILEALRVLTHRTFPNPMTSLDALDAVTRIADAAEMITPNQESYHVCLDLVKRYKITADKIYDAYLVATMLSNGNTEIATDNEKDFRIFPQIKALNPFKEKLIKE